MMREKRDAREADLARGGGVADDRRQGSRGASDHDILRRRALEPHRINDDIKEDGERKKRSGEPIGDDAEGHHRQNRQHQAKTQRILSVHPASWNWTPLRPPHQRVDIGIIPHVEGARGTGADRDREQRGKSDNRIDMRRRDQNPGERRKNHQRHDARF